MAKGLKLTKEVMEKYMTDLVKSFDEELFSKTEPELESYWHFKFNESKSIADNLYEFYELLSLYGNFCRRWEEHHRGSCCVVERVRDKYLMPKIESFCNSIYLEDEGGGK